MKRIIQILSSVRITVVCLFLLFVLTFWGTIAQVDHGLFETQQRFFTSFFFLASGVIPFPGAQLILWVLFFNLMAATVVYFSKYRQWTHIGIKISHFGILLYFIAAFLILHTAQESIVRLAEGESTNISISSVDSKQRITLPFEIRLKDVRAEFYPGTQVAKSFESDVTLTAASLQRDVKIFMNNPLFYKDYTVFQSSYQVDEQGREYSIFAVVKNSVRILPYIACFVVFFGLTLHFLIKAFVSKKVKS